MRSLTDRSDLDAKVEVLQLVLDAKASGDEGAEKRWRAVFDQMIARSVSAHRKADNALHE